MAGIIEFLKPTVMNPLHGCKIMRIRGFTLIEVMVALAVFAIVSVALLNNSTSTLRQSAIIQERTVATWLAEDQITALRIRQRTEENFPGAGKDRVIVESAGISWDIETQIENTENDFVRRVVVRVYRDSSEEPTSELVGFLGRH